MNLQKIKEYEDQFPKGSIIDGVVNGALYVGSKYKIAWFLKEAYSNETEGFHMKDNYDQEDAYESFFRNIATQTWHPIIYCSYGILNGFILYDDMWYIRQSPEMCEVIRNIAIINANKFPSKTGTYTLNNNLESRFIICKELIEKQIEVLQPEIHIFCKTFYLYKEMFNLTESDKITQLKGSNNFDIYMKDEKLFIDAYHPANRTLTREIFVNQIIGACKIWSELNGKTPTITNRIQKSLSMQNM